MTKSWTDTQLAYLAGILDGEGHFSLKYSRSTKRLTCQIGVGNTDLRLCEWLRETFGGAVTRESRPKPKKVVWRWYASASDLNAILTAVLPHLILKRDRAEIMIAYRKTLRGAPHPTSEAVRAARMKMHGSLALLNQRGCA